MIERKKLVYTLSTTYFDSKKRGFVHTLNKSLAKAGFGVKAFTYHRAGTPKEEVADSVTIKRFGYLPEKFEMIHSIPEEIRKSKLGLLKVLMMTIRMFFFTFNQCRKEKPDVIIGRWAFPSGYVAYLVSKFFGTKSVIEIYGSELGFTRNSKLIQKILIPAMNKSSLVIANSEYAKNEFIKLGVRKERIVKIVTPPNYVNHSTDTNYLKEFRKKFADDSEKIILFVGHLIELKGAEYAIRALQYTLEKTHLIIAGDGILMDDLKKLTKSLDLENRVTFFGMANLEEVGWLHDISDVFVCPPIIDSKGFTENLCKVIPEAMESGLPVVATNVGGVPEIVQNEKTGLLVEQKDPEALAKAINRILDDDKLRNDLVTGSKKIVDEFSVDSLEQKYIETIKGVLNLN
jgi:glycosyltransferase involved in cell wall biosynthesis